MLSVTDPHARSTLLKHIVKSRLTLEQTERLVCTYIKRRRFIPVPKKHTYLIRDVRIFYNTVDRAVEVMRRAGYEITAEKNELEDCTVLTVRIPKAEE